MHSSSIHDMVKPRSSHSTLRNAFVWTWLQPVLGPGNLNLALYIPSDIRLCTARVATASSPDTRLETCAGPAIVARSDMILARLADIGANATVDFIEDSTVDFIEDSTVDFTGISIVV